jgi:hypothetical protein
MSGATAYVVQMLCLSPHGVADEDPAIDVAWLQEQLAAADSTKRRHAAGRLARGAWCPVPLGRELALYLTLASVRPR